MLLSIQNYFIQLVEYMIILLNLLSMSTSRIDIENLLVQILFEYTSLQVRDNGKKHSLKLFEQDFYARNSQIHSF